VDQNTSLKSQAHAVFATAGQISLLDAAASLLAELLFEVERLRERDGLIPQAL